MEKYREVWGFYRGIQRLYDSMEEYGVECRFLGVGGSVGISYSNSTVQRCVRILQRSIGRCDDSRVQGGVRIL